MSLVEHRNAIVTPINGQSEFKVSEGQMTINFEISGAPNELLDLNSIRLNMSALFTQNDLNLNNNNFRGTGNYPTEGYINIDERIGLSSLIQSIRIEDSQNNILEFISNYPHLMASILPQMLNQDDLTTWCGPCYGIKSAGKRDCQMTVCNQLQNVSLKLYTGLTNSRPIPFSSVGQILRLTITLNNPQSVFYGGSLNNAQLIGVNSPVNGTTYALKNVKLNYRVIEMDGPAPSGAPFVYRQFSNLQSTINSSRFQNMYSPNTSNTIAIINNFVPSDSLNNYNRNSYFINKLSNGRDAATNVEELVNIKESQFKINGVNAPLQFPVDEREITPNYDVLKSLYYMSTITPYNMIKRSLISSATEQYGGSYKEGLAVDRRPVAAGTGIRYDNLNSGEGVSFKGGNNYLQVIDSDLNGLNPNEIMTTVYSFKKIVLSPSGSVIVN